MGVGGSTQDRLAEQFRMKMRDKETEDDRSVRQGTAPWSGVRPQTATETWGTVARVMGYDSLLGVPTEEQLNVEKTYDLD